MSKPVKDLIIKEYRTRFEGLDGAVLVEIRGMSNTDTAAMRGKFRESKVRVTIVRNTLAKKAFAGTTLEALAPGLAGPTAVVYGSDSVVNVARDVIKWAKGVEQMTLKGACIEGEWYAGPAGVKRLSEFPTKEESQANVVLIALSPGRKVVGAAVAPGRRVLGIVKEIQDRLEKGEAIAAKA